MHLRPALLLLFLLALLPDGANAAPLRDGERLTFRVGWGIFQHAGDITITAEDETQAGQRHTRVVTETSSRGFIRFLFPFDGRVDSLFDPETGRLLAAHAETASKRKRTQASIVFNYQEGVANYVDVLRPERSTKIPIPEGRPMDLITSLISTRFWEIGPGEQRPIAVLFDDEFYDLTVRAEGVEPVATADGRQPALRLVPHMEGEPKGLFRKGGSIRVWLSEHEPRLPVRLEVSIKVGTATAVLTEYQPPTRVARAAHAGRAQ